MSDNDYITQVQNTIGIIMTFGFYDNLWHCTVYDHYTGTGATPRAACRDMVGRIQKHQQYNGLERFL